MIYPEKIEIDKAIQKDGRVPYFGRFVEWMATYEDQLSEKDKIIKVL